MRRVQAILQAAGLALLGLLLPLACDGGDGGGSGGGPAAPGSSAAPSSVVLQVGPSVAPKVADRVEDLLGRVAGSLDVRTASDPLQGVPSGTLVVGVGETTATRRVIPASDVAALGAEGFICRDGPGGGPRILAADGNGRGRSYGAYALLEELGFGFLHPLEPVVPATLDPPTGSVDIEEEPRWPHRGWHLHTMHPIELTHLLNGWGPGGPHDAAGWRAMLPEWERFCEWAVANRQNRVEWVLLHAESWAAFSESQVRQDRLRELVDRAHAWGLEVGIDVPIALKQQHAFTLVRNTGNLTTELAEMRGRLDWVLDAGFDFVGTEQGFSEFTHPSDRRMLRWLDEATEHVEGTRGEELYVKIHCSTGQEADHYVDPDTGDPLNFNFLPHYADPRLGVMPHTVQHYGLDDPAPTYGRTDFADIREFMQEEAGARQVVWYPETAYWVSYDVDVPLFLPLYAERRVHDLRLIADDEAAGRTGRGAHAGAPIQGQMVFSSGWEWAYWLNDVVTARAAWNPRASAPSDRAALRDILDRVLRPFGPAAADLRDLLLETAARQHDLLIEGEVAGQSPRTVERLNGQAYLQGWETWDEISWMLMTVPFVDAAATTQPDRLGMVAMGNGIHSGPDYDLEIAPLLAEMESSFDSLATAIEGLGPRVPAHVAGLHAEIADAARITALRARQVHGLYDWVDGRGRPALDGARAALDRAQTIVRRREAAYRVPADRIAGWGENPTAYEFGYLWTVRSLHYWWRDEGKAVDRPGSPCYLNLIDPLDIAFGEGLWLPAGEILRRAGPAIGIPWLTSCLDAPDTEPAYPPNNLRSRP